MATRSFRYLAVGLVAAGGMFAGPVAVAAGQQGWNIVPSPNVPAVANTLMQVSARSASDAWAVGYAGGPGSFRTLAERWNGSAWRVARTPSPSGNDNVLTAVQTVAPANAWAVGYDTGAKLEHQALIEHWNGKTWRTVPARQAGKADNDLWGVAALAPRDVWAVGNENVGGFEFRPLIEHWNGSAWSLVPAPSPRLTGTGATLFGVAAISSRDIWAVGNYATGRGFQPLAEHWNGKRWAIVPAAVPGTAELNRISMVSPRDGWAVGSRSANRALIEHWNGRRWSVVSSPSIKASSLADVLALTPRLAWAAGTYTLGNGDLRTLIERWNGRAWTVVRSPDRGLSSELLGIGGSQQRVWAVGDSLTATLILRH